VTVVRPAVDPRDAVGLCRSCAWARTVPTPRSTFWLCQRAAADPRYDRYPRLPVRFCPGYEAGGPGTPDLPAVAGARE